MPHKNSDSLLRCCHSCYSPSTRIHLHKHESGKTCITVCGEAVCRELPHLPVARFGQSQPINDWCPECAKRTKRVRSVTSAA